MKEANRSVPRDVHDADLVFHPGLEAGGDLRYQQDVGRLERTEPGDVPVRRLHILKEKLFFSLFYNSSCQQKRLIKYQNKSEYLVEYKACIISISLEIFVK